MTRTRLIEPLTACRILIGGVVQGVGFRPFVYRSAAHHEIAGWVLNGNAGVEIQAEATASALDAFIAELKASPPPAAQIRRFDVCRAEPEGLLRFEIRESRRESSPTVRISPDLATCEDCLRELNEDDNPRRRYPYINCTNCGPRFSIIRKLPYDRPATTMADWTLCERCREEYELPSDRRYHAQPVACAVCGPNYYMQVENERKQRGESAIRAAAQLLAAGEIVAIKGIGGYHLACDARNCLAVGALRTRKFRKEKPFAVMVRSLNDARELVDLSAAHQELLESAARPIVVAPARCALPEVAPGNRMLGVMLPYAPLHHLLFQFGAPSPLVLTSANRSSEPIPYRDDDARQRLAGIADAFLIGERPIARRVDDSVTTIRNGKPLMIRRGRGYAPGAVCTLPTDQPILALGSDLKNAIALVVKGEVFVSQHIGDLGDRETNLAFTETVHDLLAMYEISPSELTVVHDLHPQFCSTRLAATFSAKRSLAVQHHRAHLASVLTEHGLFEERVVGVALDGTGYGDDGSIWGCEFFVGGLRAGFQRCHSLSPVAMPGGDAAARFPAQAAAGFLAPLKSIPAMTAEPFHFPRQFAQALRMIKQGVRCWPCSSAGRLFDAVAAILGFTRATTFEGQAAIWLEQQAMQVARQRPYPFPALDHRPLFQGILQDRAAGRSVPEIAGAFHASFSQAIADQIRRLCVKHAVQTIALSGGVFQNELLWSLLQADLETERGLRLVTNELVPVNDGGIALGQAAVAALLDGQNPTESGIPFASENVAVLDMQT